MTHFVQYSPVIALDRANAEDALLPIPKMLDPHEEKKRHIMLSIDTDATMVDLVDRKSDGEFVKREGSLK